MFPGTGTRPALKCNRKGNMLNMPKKNGNRTRHAAAPAGGSHRRATSSIREKHPDRWSEVVTMIGNAGRRPAGGR